MFYEGNLQSGIAEAIQQQKLVVCFVKGDNKESAEWESSYLREEDIQQILGSRAITFRLEEGSQETTFLGAFCPISATPQLVVIRDGVLQAQLSAGLSRGQFKHGILTALSSKSAPNSQTQEQNQNHEQPSAMETDSQNQNDNDATPPAATNTNARVQAMLEERRRRLEVDKAAKEKAEKETRQAAARALREEAESAAPGTPQSNRAKYAKIQRDRKAAARNERERILKNIENDKLERREKDRRMKEARAEGESEALQQQSPLPPRPSSETLGECSLKVRMLDGTHTVSRFSTGATIDDVRKWIDEQGDQDKPYTLKHLLTPLPNRHITISEEKETLRALGLSPSATLIKIPVQSHTTTNAPRFGPLSAMMNYCYGLVMYIIGLLMNLLGRDRATTKSDHRENVELKDSETTRAKTASSINIQTLHDRRTPKADQHYYNGNQLDFESRDDEDEDTR